MSETVSTLLKADKNVLFAYMFGSCVDGSADDGSQNSSRKPLCAKADREMEEEVSVTPPP